MPDGGRSPRSSSPVQQLSEVPGRDPEGLAHAGGVEHAVVGGQATGEVRAPAAGGLPALTRQGGDVGQGGVGQGVGGGVRDGAGHVGHAVEHGAVDEEGGGGVGGGSGVLEAATLVDGDVHEDAAAPHPRHRGVGDEAGGTGPGKEDGTDDEVGTLADLLHRQRGGEQGADAAATEVLDVTHPLGVDVEDRDVSPHAVAHAGGGQAGGAAAQDHHAATPHTGGPSEEDAGSPVGAQECVGPHLGGQAPGDLGHGRQERQVPGVGLDGLVGEGGDPAVQELTGQLRVRGQVQVGEEHESASQERVLGRYRFLDLEDHLGAVPDLLGAAQERGAGGGVLLVVDAGAEPGPDLDGDLMALLGQGAYTGRGDSHPPLVVLDLGGDTDPHGPASLGVGLCPTTVRREAASVRREAASATLRRTFRWRR